MLSGRTGVLARLISFLLSLTLMVSCLPAAPALALGKPQVSLSYDQSVIPAVGETMYFTLTGVNTAAVQLMVVTPSSRQEFFEGDKIAYTLTESGLYTFIAYGVNTTDNQDPSQELCMSAPISFIPGGSAAPSVTTPPPQTMTGTITISVMDNSRWVALDGMHFYTSQLPLIVTLAGDNVPADAKISIRLSWYQSEYSLVSESVGLQTSWAMNASAGISSLLGEYRAAAVPLTVTAVVTSPDGQTLSASADFTLDTFTNEMRYVNQFIGPGGSLYNDTEGLALAKWLDMVKVPDSQRINSGYLMLEQEMEHQTSFGYWAGNVYIKWVQKSLEVLSSFGTSLITNGVTNLILDETFYERKFGDAGKEAFPYYTTLSSVYYDYAVDLMAEIEAVGNGALVEEMMAEGTVCWEINVPEGSLAADAEKTISAGQKTDKVVKGIAKEIFCHNPVDTNKNIFIMGSSAPWPGNEYTLTITDITYQSVPSPTDPNVFTAYPVLTYRNEQGGTGQISVAELSARAMQGDTLELNISDLMKQDVDADRFMQIIQNGTDQFLADPLSASAGGILGYNKDIRFIVDPDHNITYRRFGMDVTISGELIDRFGLQEYLSDTEKFYYDAYVRHGYNTTYDTDAKLPDYVSAGLSGVTTALSWMSLNQNLDAKTAQQQAYFSAFNSISDEYLSMLYRWYDSLEDSTVPDAQFQRAAVHALIVDICQTRDQSLSKAQQRMNVATLSAADIFSTVSDTISFVEDMVNLLPALRSAKEAFTGQIVRGMASYVGVAKTTAIVNTFTKLKTGATVLGLGSFVMNLMSSRYLSFEEDVHSTYYIKWSLYNETLELLQDYGRMPSHHRAVQIIQALNLMKELKYHGEDLIATYYLMDMYKDFHLESAACQMVLWNEMAQRSGNEDLDFNQYIRQVWVIHENVVLGSVAELKKQDVKFDELGLFEVEATSVALGDEIVAVYQYGGTSSTYHGRTLEKLPAMYASLPTDRSSATGVNGDYAYARISISERQGWQDKPAPTNTESLYREKRYLYSRDGLELLLTHEEFLEYSAGETEINRILNTYGDQRPGFFQFQARDEQQYVQRLLWLKLTRRYIESLPMYDPTVSYR
ncbi:MAG: hypothetical protein IJ507_01940 [Clostridia bacterium]|nr:hypothetical protein [Clostridia bacterium]